MKTLHTALRVSDRDVSLHWYTSLGYEALGAVDLGDATLTMLKFPDELVVSLELVHRPADGPVDIGTGFSHLVVQVDDIVASRDRLLAAGLEPGPVQLPGGRDGPNVAWLTDPDGYRVEVVQWPSSQPDGMTRAMFTKAQE